MSKKFLWLILALATGVALFLIGKNVLADNTGDPFSGETSTNIGAWYDETWEASGFYNLKQVGNSTNFKYEYTNNPTNTSPSSGPSADLVVTEWDVTGHVHFSSGL